PGRGQERSQVSKHAAAAGLPPVRPADGPPVHPVGSSRHGDLGPAAGPDQRGPDHGKVPLMPAPQIRIWLFSRADMAAVGDAVLDALADDPELAPERIGLY